MARSRFFYQLYSPWRLEIAVQILIFAIGKMKKGAASQLCDDYFQRFAQISSSLGFHFSGVKEILESRHTSIPHRRKEEEAMLLAQCNKDTYLILLDGRGKALTSDQFAQTLTSWRDQHKGSVLFALGGPDGYSESIQKRADFILSFGPMTWPHQLARIMLAEQLYRATTILNNHPYHR